MTEKYLKWYLEEIKDVDWVAEVICERFDNALDMLTDKSLIYGGAIRDVLAGKQLEGDLDISVIPEEFSMISNKFHENPRWVPCKTTSSKYPSELPMSDVTSFVNMNGVVVQLVVTNDYNKDRLQAAMYPARVVDFICCGLVMLNDGRIFEVIPDAHKDCKGGVLRLNEFSEMLVLESLPARIEKLTSRGWKNLINVDKVTKNIKTKRTKSKKVQHTAQITNDCPFTSKEEIKQFLFSTGNDTEWVSGGEMQEFAEARQIEPFDDILSIFDHISKRLNHSIRVLISPLNKVYYECADKNKAFSVHVELKKWMKSLKNDKTLFKSVHRKYEHLKSSYGYVKGKSTTSWIPKPRVLNAEEEQIPTSLAISSSSTINPIIEEFGVASEIGTNKAQDIIGTVDYTGVTTSNNVNGISTDEYDTYHDLHLYPPVSAKPYCTHTITTQGTITERVSGSVISEDDPYNLLKGSKTINIDPAGDLELELQDDNGVLLEKVKITRDELDEINFKWPQFTEAQKLDFLQKLIARKGM